MIKKSFLILPALLLCLGVAGCKKKEEEKPIPANVEFKDVSVKETQRLIQGKWKVYRTCGGGVAGCQDLTGNYYREFVDVNTFRVTNPDSIYNYNIKKWERTEDGCKITYDWRDDNHFASFVLTKLVNDSLTFSSGGINEYGINLSVTYWVVKVK